MILLVNNVNLDIYNKIRNQKDFFGIFIAIRLKERYEKLYI